MKRIIFIAVILSLMAGLPAWAQSPPVVTDFDLETTSYGLSPLPLGTTVNNNIVVFYEHYNSVTREENIYARVVSPTAAVSARKLIATDIQWGSLHHWVAVWSPSANRFMVVYRKNNGIHARAVNSAGSPIGGSKKIANYTGDPLHITWSYGKKFVVFLTGNGEVTAQVLRRTGKRFRAERKLTNVATGTAFPVGAATEKSGIPLTYVAYYDSAVFQLTPAVIKVNNKLKVLDEFEVTSPLEVKNEYWARNVEGAYDPGNRVHALMWNLSVHARYCTFDENGAMIKPGTLTPQNFTPKYITYNPANKTFSALYYRLNYFNNSEHSEFYFMTYKTNGTIVNAARLLKQTTAENEGYGACYSRNGNILVAWINDPGPGIHARLIH